MKPEAHGGDLLRMAATAGRDPASLLDFSVNVRPEGPPEFIRAALFRAMTALAAYPSPHAEEAMLAAARHHEMDPSGFVFGSGSNELIHALARVLRKRGVPSVHVVEPAFSEYAIACRLAGLEVIPVWGGIIEKNQGAPATGAEKDKAVPKQDLLGALTDAPAGSAVFLANPGNPSGLFRTPDECLRLMSSRSDLLWIIDEAFVEYAGTEAEASVLQRLPKNGIALRSLTKFHAVPGVRLGYLAADAELAQAIRDELPAWSVNAFALAAAQAVFADTSDFAAQTRAENAERRADLDAALSSLPGIEVYPSAANYVLFRWPGAPRNLLGILLKCFGIAVRDCSNYHGLKDGSWFRAAVRFPEDHRRLAEAREDGLDLPLRHFGDVRLHFGVQLFAQLVRGELFGQHGGDVFEHRQHVGIALVQLGADLAIRLVGDLHDLLIKREPLCIEEGFFELALPHRHIPDDEHRAAALGQPPDLGKVFFVRQAEGSGRKNDAVLQLQAPIVHRAQDGLVHDHMLPFCAAFCSSSSSWRCSSAVRPVRFRASQP